LSNLSERLDKVCSGFAPDTFASALSAMRARLAFFVYTRRVGVDTRSGAGLAHGGPCGDPQHGNSGQIGPARPCQPSDVLAGRHAKARAGVLADAFRTAARRIEMSIRFDGGS
jgi:hypothetical protein